MILSSFAGRATWAVARRASALGSATGVKWLTYNPGVFLRFHQLALRDAPLMADALALHLPAFDSIADVGCGSGAFAAEFQRRGFRVGACEYSRWGRWFARCQGVKVKPFDVSRSSAGLDGAPFDLVMSVEVAEHIPPDLADAFVRYLTAAARDTIVLTAAHPGQRGQGHVNEQPKEYWIQKLRERGWHIDPRLSGAVGTTLGTLNASGWLRQNMMVYRRSGTPLAAIHKAPRALPR